MTFRKTGPYTPERQERTAGTPDVGPCKERTMSLRIVSRSSLAATSRPTRPADRSGSSGSNKAGKKTPASDSRCSSTKGSFAEVDRFVVTQNHDFGMDAQRIPGTGW